MPETVYKCTDCEAINEDNKGAHYTCNNCGNEFTYEDEGTHRCSGCGKFAAKDYALSCNDCDAEVEEVQAEYCEDCDEWIEITSTVVEGQVRTSFDDHVDGHEGDLDRLTVEKLETREGV